MTLLIPDAPISAVPVTPRILVVEDDPDIASLLQLHLADLPCSVDLASDGLEALERLLGRHYQAIVLDVALPRLDGLALCRIIRQRHLFTPILMLTARTSESDRVTGIEAGADDYVTKPFSISEVQARVKALIRRVNEYVTAPVAPAVLQCGALRIETARRLVTVNGKPVELTAKEFDLLAWFARHPGHVYTREQLLDTIWGYNHAGYAHTVNSHINRLRAKIESEPAKPEFILTVWSVGYKFRD